MNGINSKTTHSTATHNSKHVQSVETAGSLAMNTQNPFAGVLSTPLMDVFSSSNPFIVDYAQYANCNYVPSDCAAAASGFLGGFESAVSTLGSTDCASSSDGTGACAASDGGFAGASAGAASFAGASCGGGDCGGGSFTSVC